MTPQKSQKKYKSLNKTNDIIQDKVMEILSLIAEKQGIWCYSQSTSDKEGINEIIIKRYTTQK